MRRIPVIIENNPLQQHPSDSHRSPVHIGVRFALSAYFEGEYWRKLTEQAFIKIKSIKMLNGDKTFIMSPPVQMWVGVAERQTNVRLVFDWTDVCSLALTAVAGGEAEHRKSATGSGGLRGAALGRGAWLPRQRPQCPGHQPQPQRRKGLVSCDHSVV